jgi:hypothetical protein
MNDLSFFVPPHHESAHSRRDFLARAGGGLGLLALLDLLEGDARGAEKNVRDSANPMAARRSHRPAAARSVIWASSMAVPAISISLTPSPH